jgi:hypothetical protein
MSTQIDVQTLFQAAQSSGTLSTAAMHALTIADIGAMIQAGLGTPVDDVMASEAVLVTMMPDDSGSIRFAGNAQVVRDGHNLVLESLQHSQQRDSILAHTRFLNGHVLFPYCPILQTVQLDTHNYDPALGTPLYDQTVVLLGTVLAKAQEFAENGVPVRTVTLLITDGADAHSQRATAQTVATLVHDMRQAETHIVAAMGIDDGSTDFRQVFRDMGIEDQWILTPGNDANQIRRAFQVFSQSAVRVSQSAAHFGQAVLGGFGTP